MWQIFKTFKISWVDIRLDMEEQMILSKDCQEDHMNMLDSENLISTEAKLPSNRSFFDMNHQNCFSNDDPQSNKDFFEDIED